MSETKTFSNETAERYALALFEISDESSELDSVELKISQLLKIYNEHSEFRNFIKNPTNHIDIQIRVFEKISNIFTFNNNLKNFFKLIIEKRRIFFLDKILKKFLILCSKKKGKIDALLTSSKKLSNEEIADISRQISNTIGSKVELTFKVNQDLIGGIKLQVGSLLIDTSIKNKLKKFKQLMVEN